MLMSMDCETKSTYPDEGYCLRQAPRLDDVVRSTLDVTYRV